MIDFFKYQAAGNDYLVIDPRHTDFPVTREAIRLVCDRHLGIGADGVLYGPLEPPRPGVPVSLDLYNSDGSDCGRSGNGLRMFALHLAGQEPGAFADGREFTLRTAAGDCPVRVLDAAAGRVEVGMGRPSFDAADLPLLREDGTPYDGRAVDVPLAVDGDELTVTCVYNGNPHTVVRVDDAPSAELARRLGPGIAGHPRFPDRTNVQFMRMADRSVMELEVFERGAGYVTASGASACAAVSAARELGLCDSRVEVRMPGGTVEISVAEDGHVTMTGDAEQVAAGSFAPALRARLDRTAPAGTVR